MAHSAARARTHDGATADNLFPEYAKQAGSQEPKTYRTAIDDTSFSPEVKAKVADWHRRSDDLLSSLDDMLARRRQTLDPHLAEAERLCNEARAILACIRAALTEVLDATDPLADAVRRVKARLPPLAPAAAEAVCDLSETEIAAVRALNRSPPPLVRTVVVCCCTLLKLAKPRHPSSSDAAVQMASWDESQAMLARPDFSKGLRGFDPATLHEHPATAASVRSRLASLADGGSSAADGSATRRALSRARVVSGSRQAPELPAAAAAVRQVATLRAAVRSGGHAVGQLYLWCAVRGARAALATLSPLRRAACELTCVRVSRGLRSPCAARD
jgi:hypothetical protein